MSFLDISPTDQGIATRPQPNERADLPATFSDTFAASWEDNRLFGQSVAGNNARTDAVWDYVQDLQQKTGKDIASGFQMSDAAGNATDYHGLLDQANAAAEKYGQPSLSEDDLEQRAVAKSKAAQDNFANISAQEKTFGGKVGSMLGGMANAATDPINLLALPIAPETEGVGVLAAALRWGIVGATAQAGVEAIGAPYREEVQPGYVASGAPLENVAGAFAGGLALGGTTKALGNLWTRVKTGAWPQAVRDAGNIAESEANVSNTNIFPGTEGEVAHRTAMTSAIDNTLAGKPIDTATAITPELAAVGETRQATLEREAGRLPPQMQELSEQKMIAARDDPAALADTIDQIAKEGYEVDLPPDAAKDMAERLTNARDVNAAARSVTDELLQRRAEAPPPPRHAEAQGQPETEPLPVTAPDKAIASPDYQQALRADIDRERMTGDRQIPVGVDQDGEPVYRSLDGAMDEVDAYKTAADHIASCAAPAPEKDEAA